MKPVLQDPGRVAPRRCGLARLLPAGRTRGLGARDGAAATLYLLVVLAAAIPAAAAGSTPGPLRAEVGPVQFHWAEERAEAELEISLTHSSPAAITIQAIRSSCGCTVLRTPALPWRLAPGRAVTFSSRVDLRGRTGDLHKTITVETADGSLPIPVKITIPATPFSEERRRNQLLALSDPRAIFRDDCRKCHVEPAEGKSGADLYRAACGICHDATPRASAVPDLHASAPRSPEVWRQWIEQGKPGSLMPPFSVARGGILTAPQVDSLVRFLTARDSSDAPSPHRSPDPAPVGP